jgi:hypothetical protein
VLVRGSYGCVTIIGALRVRSVSWIGVGLRC